MKAISLIIISIFTLGISYSGFSQVDPATGSPGAIPGQPILVTGESVVFELVGQQTQLNVLELNVVVKLLHKGSKLEGVKILSSAGTALEVTKERSIGTANVLGKYHVEGHPKGHFTLIFTEIEEQPETTASKQKNRRVEMTIEYC